MKQLVHGHTATLVRPGIHDSQVKGSFTSSNQCENGNKITAYLVYARSCDKHFVSINSLNPHNKPVRYNLTLYPLSREVVGTGQGNIAGKKHSWIKPRQCDSSVNILFSLVQINGPPVWGHDQQWKAGTVAGERSALQRGRHLTESS